MISSVSPLSLMAGQVLNTSCFYQDRDSSMTIEFFLDNDKNPYNAGWTSLGSLSRSTSGELVESLQTSMTISVFAGTYWLCARATDTVRTRYYYFDKSPITVMQTLPKPVVHSPTRGAGGLFSFQVSCLPSLVYFVEASTNFLNWEIVLLTNTTATAFSYQEAISVSRPWRFYRVGVGSPPAGMALIPAGSFTMGNSEGAAEGNSDELPQHTVNLSAFYMDRTEVMNGKMEHVMQWAWDTGKLFVSSSGVYNREGSVQKLIDLSSPLCRITFNGSQFGNEFGVKSSKGSGYPCLEVTWYGAVAFCNYRSLMEGLTPCYNLSDWSCNWSANGYRLPTEAEWERAARGGVNGYRFPWSDAENISHSRANYRASLNVAYDLSYPASFHPSFIAGGEPYTSPVASFSPNAFGLYDMAGNLWEWCWDRYGFYSSTVQTDPHGPTAGSNRVMRGGAYYDSAMSCRVSLRNGNAPDGSANHGDVGFRCVRAAVQ
jgi:formylglycine-generating enzyme required for sulfatase activity